MSQMVAFVLQISARAILSLAHSSLSIQHLGPHFQVMQETDAKHQYNRRTQPEHFCMVRAILYNFCPVTTRPTGKAPTLLSRHFSRRRWCLSLTPACRILRRFRSMAMKGSFPASEWEKSYLSRASEIFKPAKKQCLQKLPIIIGIDRAV